MGLKVKSKTAMVALLVVCFVKTGIPAGSGLGAYVGFTNGNEYQSMSRYSKTTYVTGIYDGIQLAPFLGAPMERLHLFHKRTEGMTNEQITAIVDKYMKDNPQEWHKPMNFIVFTALTKAIGLKPLP